MGTQKKYQLYRRCASVVAFILGLASWIGALFIVFLMKEAAQGETAFKYLSIYAQAFWFLLVCAAFSVGFYPGAKFHEWIQEKIDDAWWKETFPLLAAQGYTRKSDSKVDPKIFMDSILEDPKN